jgi:hypothetical protein
MSQNGPQELVTGRPEENEFLLFDELQEECHNANDERLGESRVRISKHRRLFHDNFIIVYTKNCHHGILVLVESQCRWTYAVTKKSQGLESRFAVSGGTMRYWFSSCLKVSLHIKIPTISLASSLIDLPLVT